MTSADSYDVAVIGYGPTGATAANLLGQLGLKVLVVERDPDIYGRARAISTDEEVMRLEPDRRRREDVGAEHTSGHQHLGPHPRGADHHRETRPVQDRSAVAAAPRRHRARPVRRWHPG